MARITFNGRSYESVADMPPDVRATYDQITSMFADADGNGVPDIFEGRMPAFFDGDPAPGSGTGTGAGTGTGTGTGTGGTTSGPVVFMSNVEVDGVSYRGADDMPPEVRQRYEQAMARVRGFGLAPGTGNPASASTAPTDPQWATPPVAGESPVPGQPPPITGSPVIQERGRTGSRGVLVAVVIAVLVLLVLGLTAALLAR